MNPSVFLFLSSQESQNVEEAFMMMAQELMARNGLQVQQGEAESSKSTRVILRSNSRPVNGTGAAYAPPEKKTCC